MWPSPSVKFGYIKGHLGLIAQVDFLGKHPKWSKSASGVPLLKVTCFEITVYAFLVRI